ncbi:response regulator transcription factor [Catenulispora subtropica]|uniref:Response regulator transcription factor n=1 Tax=Catenulispora subtropica TaxID=450798 RepID=A0ABN2RD16_9ACTN
MTAINGSAKAGRAGRHEARVLVVDDEQSITDLVGLALRYEGFDVAVAATGREALAQAAAFSPDLVVLDVLLPDLTGLEVCSRLRAGGRPLPVVFLTARDATEDKVAGLTIGGDDYVTKPFALDELVARIRAVLRRTRPALEDGRLEYADLVVDEEAHEARRAGERLDLTPTEFSLLRYLVLNAGRVLSKAQILDHVWQYDFGGSDNVVETYISYLRKKVDRFEPPMIHTVRHVGYVLRLPRD